MVLSQVYFSIVDLLAMDVGAFVDITSDRQVASHISGLLLVFFLLTPTLLDRLV